MPKKLRKTEDAVPATTTAPGLIALLDHIANATAQGQLDPEFARKLGKRVRKEADALIEDQAYSNAHGTQIRAALATLEEAVSDSEGGLLGKAVKRLRDADKRAAESTATK
ncbi:MULTISPECIES: hypothetical protein [Cupriavidus]|uniref:hypothetical protein n=1 Tax=Cupriavidus TaxID=106589 RepID=UPI0016045510|nr:MULTISPECIES: hypothetical protein [Cupriavidus]MBB1631829.1 hypothetical protein [Cupriavidus sp. UME77]MCP3022165.1 hypothetical protein [Cupriavidus basilensis]